MSPTPVDPRFSLANERTYLAWIRTAVALVAGGIVAAKGVDFDHELWRWVVAGPPLVAGGLLGAAAARRWRSYEQAMERSAELPVGGLVGPLSIGIAVYAALALLAVLLD